jgi:hypothetical protein
MKKTLIVSVALSGLLVAPMVLADKDEIKIKEAPAIETNQKTSPVPINTGVTVVTKDEVFRGSDSLAIGDPLEHASMNAMHDAGPPLTQRLPYGHNCSDDACARAERRWGSSGTTWRDDKASGLNLGWGGSAPKSSMKSEPSAPTSAAPAPAPEPTNKSTY